MKPMNDATTTPMNASHATINQPIIQASSSLAHERCV
jgi:hypothetical protein